MQAILFEECDTDMDVGPFYQPNPSNSRPTQPNPLHVVSRPNLSHQTRVIMTNIYISFVFIQESLRHKIQLAATVMHERLRRTRIILIYVHFTQF